MSSFLRRLQKKILRKRSEYTPTEPAIRYYKDGGYSVLRPTKGWLKVSAKRAQLWGKVF